MFIDHLRAHQLVRNTKLLYIKYIQEDITKTVIAKCPEKVLRLI